MPPSDKEEVTLETATKVMLLCDQQENRIVLYDVPSRAVVWEWDVRSDGLAFKYPDDAKAVEGKSQVLLTANGGAALVRIADKKVLWYTRLTDNAHSAELLPDGSIVVASSTGNKLRVYRRGDESSPYVASPASVTELTSAHNVVWDKKRNCLWSASNDRLIRFAYNPVTGSLSLSTSFTVPFGWKDAHDLAQVWGEDALLITFNSGGGVLRFDCGTETFTVVDTYTTDFKCISSGPEGYPTVTVKPNTTFNSDNNWCSTEVRYLNGSYLFTDTRFKFYKARWFIDYPFSY